jgi:hypothetical protein
VRPGHTRGWCFPASVCVRVCGSPDCTWCAPLSVPVWRRRSMRQRHVARTLAHRRPRRYFVTWKADGTRYLILLTRFGTYLIDRAGEVRAHCALRRQGGWTAPAPAPAPAAAWLSCLEGLGGQLQMARASVVPRRHRVRAPCAGAARAHALPDPAAAAGRGQAPRTPRGPAPRPHSLGWWVAAVCARARARVCVCVCVCVAAWRWVGACTRRLRPPSLAAHGLLARRVRSDRARPTPTTAWRLPMHIITHQARWSWTTSATRRARTPTSGGDCSSTT